MKKEKKKRRRSYFDERHPHSVLLDVLLDGVTHPQDELVRHHEDQDVGSLHRLGQVGNRHLTQREAVHPSVEPADSGRAGELVVLVSNAHSPRWGAACGQADISRFRGLC